MSVNRRRSRRGARNVASTTEEWDSVPENWTVPRIIEELEKLEITASSSLGKRGLISLYKEYARQTPPQTPFIRPAQQPAVTSDEPQYAVLNETLIASGTNTNMEAILSHLQRLESTVADLRAKTQSAPTE